MSSICSMTGFGKMTDSSDKFQLNIEIKSVNHRFKEIRFKIPSFLSSQELTFRKLINDNFKRGSFEIYISLKKESSAFNFDKIDTQKVQVYLKKIKMILDKEVCTLNVNAADFLRPDFFKDEEEGFAEDDLKFIEDIFLKAILELKRSRKIEGDKLLEVLKGHRDEYLNYFLKVEENIDSLEEVIKSRLEKKFKEFQSKILPDDPRFIQELIFYLEKLDINEEIDRIKVHMDKIDLILLKDEAEIGRELDFLIQELNRETNTIGSKSTISEISESVIKMKVHLEKMREQGLNLE